MINHINKQSLDTLASIMNQHVDNIFLKNYLDLLQIEVKKN